MRRGRSTSALRKGKDSLRSEKSTHDREIRQMRDWPDGQRTPGGDNLPEGRVKGADRPVLDGHLGDDDPERVEVREKVLHHRHLLGRSDRLDEACEVSEDDREAGRARDDELVPSGVLELGGHQAVVRGDFEVGDRVVSVDGVEELVGDDLERDRDRGEGGEAEGEVRQDVTVRELEQLPVWVGDGEGSTKEEQTSGMASVSLFAPSGSHVERDGRERGTDLTPLLRFENERSVRIESILLPFGWPTLAITCTWRYMTGDTTCKSWTVISARETGESTMGPGRASSPSRATGS